MVGGVLGERQQFRRDLDQQVGERQFATQLVDMGLIDYPIAAYAIGQGNFQNLRLVKSYKPTLMNSVGIGVRKDDTELMKKVNAAIDKLTANGTIDGLIKKWGL